MKTMTLGDLRKLIEEAGGAIRIGALELRYESLSEEDVLSEKKRNDVDVNLDGDLIMWFSGEFDGDRQLTDEEVFTVSGDIKKGRELLHDEWRAENKLKEAEKKLQEAATAIGKVEAYEKLLLGRSVTLGA